MLKAGRGAKGQSLTIRIEEINRVQEIRFQGLDERHYLVVPSSRDNELVMVRLTVHNREASTVRITVDEDSAELRGPGPNQNYKLLDLSADNPENIKIVEGSHPAETRYAPDPGFIAGTLELPQGYSVVAWTVFEVPKATPIRTLRWDAGGDTIYIRSKY